jgi:hypothetical protein
LLDQFPHIAGLGDVRQVNLGFELLGLSWRSEAAAAAGFCMLRKVLLDPLCFIHFNGTGVRLLFRYTDLDKNVENRLALHLEFSCQIIDSNLLHAALFPPYCPVGLRIHVILAVIICPPTL